MTFDPWAEEDGRTDAAPPAKTFPEDGHTQERPFLSHVLTPDVLLTKQAQNMGDHAQDVTKALDVDPTTTTIYELARAALVKRRWRPEGPTHEVDGDAYLTIRVRVPLVEDDGSPW